MLPNTKQIFGTSYKQVIWTISKDDAENYGVSMEWNGENQTKTKEHIMESAHKEQSQLARGEWLGPTDVLQMMVNFMGHSRIWGTFHISVINLVLFSTK